MSDSNAYINAYVDNSVSMLHEYVTMVLQLKTQLKVTSDMLGEKDQHIASLQQEMEQQIKGLKQDIENARTEANSNKADLSSLNEKTNEIADLRSKLEHMATFANQIRDMKQLIVEKDKEIEKLKEKTKVKVAKTTEKKDINSKIDEKQVVVIDKPKEERDDDF